MSLLSWQPGVACHLLAFLCDLNVVHYHAKKISVNIFFSLQHMQNINVCRDVTDVCFCFFAAFVFFPICKASETSLERKDEWFYYSNHSVSMVLVVKHGKEMV